MARAYVFLYVLWFGASALTHRLVEVVFPCCELCSLIMFGTVVFPVSCWAVVAPWFWVAVEFFWPH